MKYPHPALADLDTAETRTQDLANTVSELYQSGDIDADTLHALITDATLISASIRFAIRQIGRSQLP
jgi:hypothetical protein